MAYKVTTMVLKVDLQCPRCYNKIKECLRQFREIRDQMYDEKHNKVTITVVTCCPEVILKEISSKGGRTVEKIEIVPEKKKELQKKEGDKDKPKGAAPGKKDARGDKDKPKESAGEKKKESGAGKPKESAGEKKKDPSDKKPKQAVAREKKKDPSDKKPKQAGAGKKLEAHVHKDVSEPVSGFPRIYMSGEFHINLHYYPGNRGIPMPMQMPAYEGYAGNRGGGYNNAGRIGYFGK